MPSAAAAAAYAALKAEEEESNSISNASLTILLGTASDIVNKVSLESSVFDLTKEKSFSRFAYSGVYVIYCFLPIIIVYA